MVASKVDSLDSSTVETTVELMDRLKVGYLELMTAE